MFKINQASPDADSLCKLFRHLQGKQFSEFFPRNGLQLDSVNEENSSLFLKFREKDGSKADKVDGGKIIPIVINHIKETLGLDVQVEDVTDSGFVDELLDQAEGGEAADRNAAVPDNLPQYQNRQSYIWGSSRAKDKTTQLEKQVLQSKNYQEVCQGVEDVYTKLSNSGPELVTVPHHVVPDLRNLGKSATSLLEEIEESGPYGDNPRSTLEQVHNSDSSDDDLGKSDLKPQGLGVGNVSSDDTDC